MVIFHQSTAPDILLVAQQATEPVLERLDPPRRAAVVMALLAMVLLGLLLVTCIMIGARWVRRLARHHPTHQVAGNSNISQRGSRALSQSLRAVLPNASTGDTVQLDRSTKETQADAQASEGD
jgi:predicted PurR-regulated permease PerM